MARSRVVGPIVLLGCLLAALHWAGIPIRLLVEPAPPQAEKPATPTKIEQAVKQPESAKGSAAATAASNLGFDVARINPGGTSVFAGRADPLATVIVLADGVPVGTSKADENGEWTLVTEHKFASNDPRLELTLQPPGESAADTGEMSALAEHPAATGPAGQPGSPERPSAAHPEGVGSGDGERESRDAAQADTAASIEAVRSGLMKNLEELVASAKKTEDAPKVEEKRVTPPDQVTPPPPTALDVAKDAPIAPKPLAAAQNSAEEPIQPATVLIPITFVYREAVFTDEGRRAVNLLLEYVKLKGFKFLSLSGHADERGTEQFNLDLSRERLESVVRYLREGGYNGEFELVPLGKSQPFTGVDRSHFNRDDLYQLDRRVELRATH